MITIYTRLLQVCQKALKILHYLFDDKPIVSTGYIHKVAENKGKIILALQMIMIKKWKQHEEVGEDMQLHRAFWPVP